MSKNDSNETNTKSTNKHCKPDGTFRIRWERTFAPKPQIIIRRRALTEAEKIRRLEENRDRIAEMRKRLTY